VRSALDFKGISHVRKAVFLDYVPRALWVSGRPTLPILFLEGKAIGESTRTLEALEEFRPEPPLYPRDETFRRRAVELEDFFDRELGHQLRAAILGPMFASDPARLTQARSASWPTRAGPLRASPACMRPK
jgi:glutathione S-transferase